MRVIPREASSKSTNSSSIRMLRNSLTLNKIQHNVLIGAILGDASLVVNSWGKNYRFHVEQSDNQKSYLLWKYGIFKNFTLSPPIFRMVTNSWKFRTLSHSSFTDYRKIFYSGNKKIIPNYIDKLLKHPISVAVWFMDDGCYVKRYSTYILNTQSFTLEENIKLQRCLEKNFSIGTSLHRDKQYWRLYIDKSFAYKFKKLIERHIERSMRRKIGEAP